MRGAGGATRARLARAGHLARSTGLAAPRAQRLARRLAGEMVAPRPSLSELRQWPGWPACAPDEQARVFALAALLASRDALVEMISGAELRRYAAPFGDELFERAIGLPGSGSQPLPAPDGFPDAGRALAQRGLPRGLAEHLGHESCAGVAAGNADAARHIAEAEWLSGLSSCAPSCSARAVPS